MLTLQVPISKNGVAVYRKCYFVFKKKGGGKFYNTTRAKIHKILQLWRCSDAGAEVGSYGRRHA